MNVQEESFVVANIRRMFMMRVFLVSATIPVPIIALFWQQNGLTVRDIAVLQGVFSLGVAVLEGPSGYLADRIGRKVTLVGGALCLMLSLGIYCISHTIGPFIAAEVLMALGMSLVTGTDQAFVYETLQVTDSGHKYLKVWGSMAALDLVSATSGSILGGFLAKSWGLRTPLYAAFVGFLIMVFVTITLKNVPKKAGGKIGIDEPFLSVLWKTVIKSQEVRWLLLISALITGCAQVGYIYAQPYMKAIGVPTDWFGVVYAVFYLSGALVAALAHKVEERVKVVGLTSSLIISTSSLLLLIAFTKSVVAGIVLHVFLNMVKAATEVFFSKYLNEATSAAVRATTHSVRNMTHRIIYASVLIPMGALGSVDLAYPVLAGILFFAGGLLLLVRPVAFRSR